MEEKLSRKLVAILYADVAEYSRLTGEDEEGTHRRLSEYLDACTSEIRNKQGSVVHFAGDAILAEFPTVSDALTCAASVQRDIAIRNESFADENKVQFRIGVNLGEIIVDRDDIYGDSVNIAARLESLAEAGGICVSGVVYDAISKSVRESLSENESLTFEALGVQNLKNIVEPIVVYRLAPCSAKQKNEMMGAFDVDFSLPERPSIVVLPFQNMSADPEQEFFVDGLTEDIITRLSYLRDLLVIAKTSAFAYKGRAVQVQDISRDLGVAYVLEGSVRKVGSRIRVTAQLIDGSTGGHLWAQKFDRELTDVFAIQDEITLAIVGAMKVNLTDGEVARLEEGETHNLDAWEAFHRGALDFLRYTKESNAQARRMFEQALQLDCNYLDAKVYLAFTHCMDARSGYVIDRAWALNRSITLLDEIKATGIESANANHLEAFHNLLEGQHEKALNAAGIATTLGPCRMFGFAPSAQIHMYCGDPKTAVELLRTSMRLSPFCPPDVIYFLAYASAWSGDHENAIQAAGEYGRRIPGDLYAYVLQAIVFGLAGQHEKSIAAIRTLREHFPTYSLGDFLSHESYRDSKDLDRIAQILLAAGLPEN
jgi:TolB-like protein/class 3 adenylate cyclase